jgi:hypothetical protein
MNGNISVESQVGKVQVYSYFPAAVETIYGFLLLKKLMKLIRLSINKLSNRMDCPMFAC